jgi:hypothetical protein
LGEENPSFPTVGKVAVNELVGVRKVTVEGPLKGQHELYFRKACKKGWLVPWVGELVAEVASRPPSKYDFGYLLGEVAVVLRPNLRSAAPFCNDFAGPQRSKTHKKAHKKLLNLEFVIENDVWGRPHVAFKITRDVKKGEAGWTDYGDAYWGGHDASSDGLSKESRLWGGAEQALVLLRGTCPENPITTEAPSGAGSDGGGATADGDGDE